MEIYQDKQISGKCMLIFFQFPDQWLSLHVIEKMTISNKKLVLLELERLCSLGIIEERMSGNTSVYKYRKPDIVTSSWGESSERKLKCIRGTN